MCPDNECSKEYIGETARRLKERIIDHNKRDKRSHIYMHSNDNVHVRPWVDDYKVIGRNYQTKYKRKISEALFIRSSKPAINIQDKSFPLLLYK